MDLFPIARYYSEEEEEEISFNDERKNQSLLGLNEKIRKRKQESEKKSKSKKKKKEKNNEDLDEVSVENNQKCDWPGNDSSGNCAKELNNGQKAYEIVDNDLDSSKIKKKKKKKKNLGSEEKEDFDISPIRKNNHKEGLMTQSFDTSEIQNDGEGSKTTKKKKKTKSSTENAEDEEFDISPLKKSEKKNKSDHDKEMANQSIEISGIEEDSKVSKHKKKKKSKDAPEQLVVSFESKLNGNLVKHGSETKNNYNALGQDSGSFEDDYSGSRQKKKKKKKSAHMEEDFDSDVMIENKERESKKKKKEGAVPFEKLITEPIKSGKKEKENKNSKKMKDRESVEINEAEKFSNTNGVDEDESSYVDLDNNELVIGDKVMHNILESTEAVDLNNEKDKTESTEEVTYFPVLGSDDKKKEKIIVKRTLPKWISQPKLMIADISKGKIPLDKIESLSEYLKKTLKENEIDHLFPVQASVIPYILSQQIKGTVYGKGGLIPRDICVSAPTGSGKTLSYVLPIIQILANCFVRRLQAIVVLPSKDLAAQIKTVMNSYVKGTRVRVGLASGMKSFQHEQEQLVTKSADGNSTTVDILVCTPGRLVDHIDHTDGFSLEHLRFLIIDEADRLLGQAYHNWLEKIYKAAYRSKSDEITPRNISTYRSKTPFLTPASLDRVELPLQKLLFSATMTQNPEKLAPLQLYRPLLFTSSESGTINKNTSKADFDEDETSNERYILPESLKEKMCICKEGEKPLVVIYLMKQLKYSRVLCFTGSIDTTHRLFLLVKACGIEVAEFSSTLNQSQRKGILRDFKIGKIDLLICSDAMSRGMDIDNVQYVLSYDPPVNIKTYVHRVGRTARAGQEGMALTILYPKEAFHFKKIIRTGKRSTLQKLSITNTDYEPFVEEYENALISLKDSMEAERSQGFKHRKK